MQLTPEGVNPETAESNGILRFPRGIPGFEDTRAFRLLQAQDQSEVFVLEAVDDPDLNFAIIDPAVFNIHFEFPLDDDELGLMGTDEPSDLAVMVILYSSPNQGPDQRATDPQMHANLMGPLIINLQTGVGLQKVLGNAEQLVTIRAEA